MYPYIALLALFQAPAPQAGISLLEDCSEFAPVLATLSKSSPVEVRSSVAGYAKTCYAVTAEVNGKQVKGYVQGDGLEAVAEFERQRAAVAASIADVAPAPVAAPAVAPAPKAPPVVEKVHYPPFRDFSALDMKGRAVSAHSLRGKVNLVTFWAPGNKASFVELLAVARMQGQYKKGVDALFVSMSGTSAMNRDMLDDMPWVRNVPQGREIAARYNIDFDSLPRTYVLNDQFEVVASGLHGRALEDLVKKLMAEE